MKIKRFGYVGKVTQNVGKVTQNVGKVRLTHISRQNESRQNESRKLIPALEHG